MTKPRIPKEEASKAFKQALSSEKFAAQFKSYWEAQMAELDRWREEGYFDPPPNCPLSEEVLQQELNEWDPVHLIAMGCPDDEYSPENLAIRKSVVKLPDADLELNVETLGLILFETFDDAFNDGSSIAINVKDGTADIVERPRKVFRADLAECTEVAMKILAAQKTFDERMTR